MTEPQRDEESPRHVVKIAEDGGEFYFVRFDENDEVVKTGDRFDNRQEALEAGEREAMGDIRVYLDGEAEVEAT